MASSITLFQFIKRAYQSVGVYPFQPSQNHTTFNLKNWIYLICCMQFLISTFCFLLFEAKSMFDYGIAFYVSLYLFFAMVQYSIFIFQIESTYKFIESCARFIETRELIYIGPVIFSHIFVINLYYYTKKFCRSELHDYI